jgi:hypothetical protein
MSFDWKLGSTYIFNAVGAYVFASVNQTVDMSSVTGWAAGDVLHLDGVNNRIYVTDVNGNRIPLRVAITPGSRSVNYWACSQDWLNYIGFSAWRIGHGGWAWHHTEEAYHCQQVKG